MPELSSTLRISSHKSPSDFQKRAQDRNTYLLAGITAVSALLTGATLLSLPLSAGAFWPFPEVTKAATTGEEPPLVHDSKLPLLAAALNPDPNPEKGHNDIPVTEGSALMANSGPDGTIVDVAHGSIGGEISTYVVEEGDTFSTIANKFGISTNTVLWANNLTSKSTLKPGQTLVILPVTGIEHTVQKGETVASIAKKYGGEVQDILAYNGLESSDDLTAGSKIIIPDGEPAAVPTPVKKPTISSTVKKFANLPAVSGFMNPLPAGKCSQGLHGNNGIDIAAQPGSPIYAAAAGSVIIAMNNGGWNGGFGNYVVINHPNGTQTLYAHMTSTATIPGASVAQGQLIGYVGRTGKATGNHLHFEVHKGANPFCR